MERSVTSKGKDVQAALDTALAILHAKRDEVNIEIMEQESKGFFGIKSKPAIVKVTLISRPEVEESSSGEVTAASTSASSAKLEHELDILVSQVDFAQEVERQIITASQSSDNSQVWVQDGQFRIRVAQNNYPLISPASGVKLMKNGVLVENTVPVSESDVITVELEAEQKVPEWSIVLDDQLMEATMKVKPGYILSRRLRDCEPSPHLTLSVDEVHQFIPIRQEDVYESLKQSGVVYGVRPVTIKEACEARTADKFVIARGKAPEAGQNGSFEMTFDTEARNVRPKSREDGTIDYREIKEFPTAAEGQVLGKITPPRPGIPGKNLLGNDVFPPPVVPIHIIEGQGTSWTEDGLQVVALRAGMPQVHLQNQRVRVSIVPKLVHKGDVSIESGNIHFQGDVEIFGAVQDSMKVETTGSILVNGNVNMAQINASQSLIVNANIIGSKVSVGKGSLFFAEMEPLLEDIAAKIDQLMAAVIQVSQAAAFKVTDLQTTGLRSLLDVLLKGKFKSLHSLLILVVDKANTNSNHLDHYWTEYIDEIRSGFLNTVTSHFKSIEDLEHFRHQTLYLYSIIEPPMDSTVFTKFKYAHNSNIYSGGDVHIAKGCYNTMIYCQNYMEVGGFLRGGVYFASKGMKVNEAGTQGIGKTTLHVPEQATIQIRKVLDGTVVQVGKKSHHFYEEANNICARINDEGDLVIK